MMQNIWIIGCGDIGRRLSKLYQNRPVTTRAWVRSEDSASYCRLQGLETISIDVGSESSYGLPASLQDSQLFYFVPPPRNGKIDTRLRRFLQMVSGMPKRIVLISTTGVYGDCQGQWVDESTPLKPHADRARRRLDAEHTVTEWARTQQREYVILRVPGIYAADRLPTKRLQQGLPMVRESEAPWTNRIHADDLAMICQHAMDIAPSGAIYNACDGHPSTMTAYFNQVADALGLLRPPQISLAQAQEQLSPGMLSYLRESRRIRNQKVVNELNIRLRYPTLADGLAELNAL